MRTAVDSVLLDTCPMETASERRKRKLTELCGERGLKAVASRAGLNPFALEQVIKGVRLPAKKDGTRSPRQLGDSSARAIEKAFDKPEGWFDSSDVQVIEESRLSPTAIALGVYFDQASPQERELLARLLPVDIDVDQPDLPHFDAKLARIPKK